MVSKNAAEGGRLMKVGLLKEAIQQFEAGLKENPKDAACLLGLARVHLGQQDLPLARLTLKRLLEIEPTNAEAQSHLALLDVREGNAAAWSTLQSLSELPGAGFFEHYNLAMVLQEKGDLSGARAALERADKSQPDNPFVLTELGMLALGRQEPAAAVKYLKRAAELMPNEWVPQQLHARALTLSGVPGQAIALLNTTIEQHPKVGVLYDDLFKLCMTTGNLGGAERAAIALRELKPDEANPLYLHGLVLFTQGKVAESKPLFEEAMRKAPASFEPRQALAKVLVLLKDHTGARKLLEEANAKAPAEAGPANDLALLYMEKNEAVKAEKVLRVAAAKHPEDASLALNLALALVQQNKKTEARPFVTKALSSKDADLKEQAARLKKQVG
jgi:Flp pilus assembly protein TadD